MLLHNPRKYFQRQVWDVLKEDFEDYLRSPGISRPYKYKMVNDDTIEIATYPAGVIVFALVFLENTVQIIQHDDDELALTEVRSFLSRRLQIARQQF